MSTEPQRDIEKTLKAYADRRREEAGAPLELHPATRRLLQGEAARLGPKPKERAGFWSNLVATFRSRVASTAILLLLAGVCVALLAPALSRAKRSARKTPNSADRPAAYALADQERVSQADKLANSPTPAAPTRALLPPGVAGESEKEALAKNSTITLNGGVLKSDSHSLLDETAKQKATTEVAMPTAPGVVTWSIAGLTGEKESASTALGPKMPVTTRDQALGWGGTANQAAAEIRARDFETALPAQPPAAISGYTFGPQGTDANGRNEPARKAVPAAAPSPAESKPALALTEPTIPMGSATQQFIRLQTGTTTQNLSAGFANESTVLNSFRVEQKGDQVRIIDADGSMYSGFVQNAAADTGRRVDNLQQPSAANSVNQMVTNGFKDLDATKAANAETRGVQNYFFRVSGTNRSLNQSVLFSGTLAADAKTEGGPQVNFKRAAGNAAATPFADRVSLPLSQTQVRGRALIGGTNAIEVNAAPAPR
jgi:hypothetical protein